MAARDKEIQETETVVQHAERSKTNSSPVPAGVLVVIGGAENKGQENLEKKQSPNNFTGLEVLRTFVELTEKRNPVIEVVTSASSVGDESFEDYKKVFTELGVTTIGHIHHSGRGEVLKDNGKMIERMNAADAVFFSGGDQLLLTSLYGGGESRGH